MKERLEVLTLAIERRKILAGTPIELITQEGIYFYYYFVKYLNIPPKSVAVNTKGSVQTFNEMKLAYLSSVYSKSMSKDLQKIDFLDLLTGELYLRSYAPGYLENIGIEMPMQKNPLHFKNYKRLYRR